MNIIANDLCGDLWLIVTYYNFTDNSDRLEAFKIFYDRISQQTDKIYIIELATSNDKIVLESIVKYPHKYKKIVDNECSYIWQKEQLIYIANKDLPDSCDKIGWIDGDILFDNDCWIKHTESLLNFYYAVQPFASVNLLNKDNSIYTNHNGIVYSIYASLSGFQQPALVWCYRRSIMQHWWPFLMDGYSDTYLAIAITKDASYSMCDNNPMAKDNFYALRELTAHSFNFAPYTIRHLYHGPYASRMYNGRATLCRQCGYDSSLHINIDKNGLLKWTELAPPILKKGLASCFL